MNDDADEFGGYHPTSQTNRFRHQVNQAPSQAQKDMYRHARSLLNLYRLEPFYFRNVPSLYLQKFYICLQVPIEEIIFESDDLHCYHHWLTEIAKNNSSNHNGPIHLTLIAAHLGLENLIEKFIDLKVRLDLMDGNGNTPLMLAQRRNHDLIVAMITSAQTAPATDKVFLPNYGTPRERESMTEEGPGSSRSSQNYYL